MVFEFFLHQGDGGYHQDGAHDAGGQDDGPVAGNDAQRGHQADPRRQEEEPHVVRQQGGYLVDMRRLDQLERQRHEEQQHPDDAARDEPVDAMADELSQEIKKEDVKYLQ